jgi:outer membrane protein
MGKTSIRKRFDILLIAGMMMFLAACVSTEKLKVEMQTHPPEYIAESLTPRSEIKVKMPPAKVPEKGSLKLTIKDAILLAFDNNRTLVVEKFNPSVQETFEDQARAVFDPVTGAVVSGGRTDAQRQSQSGSGIQSVTTDTVEGALSIRQFFPTGTTLAVDARNRTTDSSLYEDAFSNSRIGMTVTQALLRGYGSGVNLANLRQAELATDISLYELCGFSETLLAEVENTYWEYALSQRRIEIVEESLKISKQQLSETEEMIQVGKLAESELAASQAETAIQQQALINARSETETVRLKLLRLINPPGEGLYDRDISLVFRPKIPDITLDSVEDHVALALRLRPVVNQTKLGIKQGDLQIVRTRNGLLPKLDLFITLGKGGYADSFSGSVSDITGSGSYDALAGVNFEYPIHNRDAEARHRRSVLNREQADKALDNLNQLVELDIRAAYIEIKRTKEQITASAATAKFQEETLRIETEKFRVGRSTNFLVSQAQRDALLARINEVESIVNYFKALINFYRLEGTLLERRGIVTPGKEPVTLYDKNLY